MGAMRSGMAVVHPRRVLANRIPPLVLIERVLVDGRAASKIMQGTLIVAASFGRSCM